jgi:hypothetical protein
MQSKNLYGIRGSCFSIRVEYTPDFIIWHLASVDKYTKSLVLELKEMLSDWSEFFQDVAGKPIYVAAHKDDKIHKLIKRLGFEYLGEQDDTLVYQHVGEI